MWRLVDKGVVSPLFHHLTAQFCFFWILEITGFLVINFYGRDAVVPSVKAPCPILLKLLILFISNWSVFCACRFGWRVLFISAYFNRLSNAVCFHLQRGHKTLFPVHTRATMTALPSVCTRPPFSKSTGVTLHWCCPPPRRLTWHTYWGHGSPALFSPLGSSADILLVTDLTSKFRSAGIPAAALVNSFP